MKDLGIAPRQRFLGFDHIDTRVSSLHLVERFYDRLMPLLGLTRKRFAHVDEHGDFLDVDERDRYDAVEYYAPRTPGAAAFFIGFIERADTPPTLTRIAFRVENIADWIEPLIEAGACNVESSEDMSEYPAIFFEDPAGTKLELVARHG